MAMENAAASYMRVSTTGQLEGDISVPSQGHRWPCDQLKVPVVCEFTDAVMGNPRTSTARSSS